VPRIVAALSFLALFLGACSSDGAGQACDPKGVELTEGDKLPDCSLPMIGGGDPMPLSDLEGQATVLNFWASWCAECLKEMPAIDRWSQEHEEVRVLGVNVVGPNGETEALGQEYFAERGVSYESLVDPMANLYAHFGTPDRPILPLTVVLDAAGVIAARKYGGLDEAGLDSLVKSALS
jgi:cytochrome c biogenesis protein CcmG, thiol:disulfide interchange protein DsbE